ncbi:MAG: hypothetical protein AAF478_14135 [Pseudomonadota bacterium]
MRLFSSIFPFILTLTFVSTAHSQSTVVVVPLGGDEKPDNHIIVAPTKGDFTNPVDAVELIDDASESNVYRIYVAPGQYVVTEAIQMKPFVHVIGSGIGETTISGNVSSGGIGAASSLIVLSENSSISNFSAINGGGVSRSIGALNPSGVTAILSNIFVRGFGGQWNYGIVNNGNLTLENVTAESEDFTINLTSFSYGLYDSSGSVVKNSVLRGIGGRSNFGSFTFGGATTDIFDSVVEGDADNGALGDTARVNAANGTVTLNRVIARSAGNAFFSGHGAFVRTSGSITASHSIFQGKAGEEGILCDGSCDVTVETSTISETPGSIGIGTANFSCLATIDGGGSVLDAMCQ